MMDVLSQKSTARGGILGRRRAKPSTLPEPSISAALNGVLFTEAGSTAREGRPATCPYPDRPYPLQSGPRRDRWIRELCGSIVSRQAPILLDRRDVELALDLTPGAIDRRELPLENAVVVGDRELYRREQIRAIILSSVEAVGR